MSEEQVQDQYTRKKILKERERKKRSYEHNANISKVIGTVLAILVFIDIASWWFEANVDFEMFWYFLVISLICFIYAGFLFYENQSCMGRLSY